MPEQSSHHRTHSLLLLQRLLSFRQGISPFTLLLDTLEQSSRPLVQQYINRAKSNTIYVSFETLVPPPNITHFVRGRRKPLQQLHKEISSLINTGRQTLIIFDTLHPLFSPSPSISISHFLTSLLPSPWASILATFHLSLPTPISFPSPSPSSSLSTGNNNNTNNPYAPSPLSLFSYLATTLITVHSLHHILASKRAAERARPPPVFGLDEGKEGVVVGLGANGREVVLRVEHRRKSGRAVGGEFVMSTDLSTATTGTGTGTGTKATATATATATAKPSTNTTGSRRAVRLSTIDMTASGEGPGLAKFVLLEEHPLYRLPAEVVGAKREGVGVGGVDEAGGTFSLGLTEKQRRDREGVVLPYFDAQQGGLGGEVGMGGRILYEYGEEDAGDWDSEEDEI